VTPGADPLAVINQSVGNYQMLLSGLISSGAEHLLVPNVPNLGRTPEAMAAGVSAQATQLALLWNTILAGMLQELSQETDANIYAYDAFGAVENIFANLDEFGFTNASEPCSSMIGMVQVGCAHPDEFIFWDILHPTTAAHELIGDGAYELLASRHPVDVPLPATIWLLLPGMAMLLARRRSNKA
jgi:outer membrane lipase/esterase